MSSPGDTNNRRPLLTDQSGAEQSSAGFTYVVDQPDEEEAASGQGINIHLILNALRRWWPICLGSGLVLASIAGGIAWFTFQPIYQATGWMRIESSNPYLVYQPGGNVNAIDDRFVRTQLALLRSPIVLDRVLEDREVARLPEIREMPNPVSTLGKQIIASSEDESELFRVSYESHSPEHAALIVNTTLREFFDAQEQVGRDRNDVVIKILKAEADSRGLEIARRRAKVIELGGTLAENDVWTTRSREETAEEAQWYKQLAECETECTILESEIRVLQQQIKASESEESELDESAIDQLLMADPQILEAEELVHDVEAEYQRAVKDLGKRYRIPGEDEEDGQTGDELTTGKASLPTSILIRLRERKRIVDESRLKLAKMKEQARLRAANQLVSRQDGNATQRLRDARRRLQSQRAVETSLRGKIAQARPGTVGDEDLTKLEFAIRDLQRAESVYDQLMERVNRLETEESAPARVTVLKTADVPADPLESSPLKRVVVAALAAFSVPFGLVLLKEAIAQPIGSAEQLPTQSSVPLFAEIPSLPSRAKSGGRHYSRLYERSRAVFENSVHYLCRSMMLGQMGTDFRIMAVTSSVSGEGKTSLSGAIAASMARCMHEPVLLIDADMRKPGVHRLFELPVEPGLADVLSGECTFEEAIVETSIKNVWLLPAGQVKAHPHALLRQSDFTRLMAEVRERFNLTILDTSPALAVGESLTVCKAADGVLLCAMRDVTRRSQIKRACDRLRLAGINPMGIVLGGVDSGGYEVRNGAYYYEDVPDDDETDLVGNEGSTVTKPK